MTAPTSAQEHERIGGRILSLPFLVMIGLVILAGYVLYFRYVYGLGSVTNLSDGYPWGIWIAIDLVAGTAFGCAGYSIAIVVYILNRGAYHPLVRPAILASLFGYTLGGLAVLIDLGRYWQGYNMLLPWLTNVNSVMLETALCIGAYITVLMIEFAPAFLERFGMTDIRRTLGRFLFVIVALGVLLPTMHQSSMGTILVVLGYRLSPLWQTNLLPVFFLISALFMGYAIVVFESILSSVGFRRPMEREILSKVTGIMAILVAVFLVLRTVDLIVRDDVSYAFRGDSRALMFWIETAMHVLALVVMVPRRNRAAPRPMFIAASMMLLGGTLYRVNCYLIGYDAGPGWHYFPSVGEILVTLGIFSIEIILYIVFVKQLPVLHRVEPRESDSRHAPLRTA